MLEGKQNSEKYTDTLEADLLPFAEEKRGFHWILVKDGASVKCSDYTSNWFRRAEIEVMR